MALACSLHRTNHLAPDEVALVRSLVEDAAAEDGVSPLSEQGMLRLDSALPGVIHILATSGAQLLGYAQLVASRGTPPSAELAVAAPHRREGIGTVLLDRVLAAQPQARIWAHGMLPGARALAGRAGLTVVRELLRLARPLSPDDAFDTTLPQGYEVATFTDADGPQWLALNAAAFADHPEQGRLTRADLADRMVQPWFDPAGFFLIRDREGRLAAFHWTKVEDDVGEVYVVGVAPDRQGLGLGRAATAIGLAHLRDAGLPRVVLYVDGDNDAALATYVTAGFERDHVDAQLARLRVSTSADRVTR
ncbi:MAG: mycothiol synthase [Dermatophilaceae bacterium]